MKVKSTCEVGATLYGIKAGEVFKFPDSPDFFIKNDMGSKFTNLCNGVTTCVMRDVAVTHYPDAVLVPGRAVNH